MEVYRRFLFAILLSLGGAWLAFSPRCALGADLTISNQVVYHHREVAVRLDGVPLEAAVLELYRTALAPRAVSFQWQGPRATGELLSIVFQGPPWKLLDVLVGVLEARGFTHHTTVWGSDVITRNTVELPAPTAPPATPPEPTPFSGLGQ